jgi:dienelactone hydrolase
MMSKSVSDFHGIQRLMNGQIPRIFHEACDELNLIAIGVDNNGNARELTDRLQTHLDSIATIQAHYRIDPRRVYVTGMSGGGRCSSILQLAFPDVFMGAVPIVGLDSYHRTPTGSEGKYWPERLAKPAARWFRLLKHRRFAAITGTMDFNAPEMRTRTQQMKQDNINIRLDIIEGMGHTMPSSEQFHEALKWVDELQQEQIKAAADEAKRALDNFLKRSKGGLATDTKDRIVLIQITIDAPWSEAAWEAARLLGIED